MEHLVQFLNIKISETSNGMYFATSENQPTFFVSALNMQSLYELIPLAAKEMFKTRDKLDVNAFPTNEGDLSHKLWAIVPRNLTAGASNAGNV